MVKPEPWENPMLDTMWSFMQMGGLKANYPALKEACMELRQMLMQKTAGQRKDSPKDLSWENLERVKVTILHSRLNPCKLCQASLYHSF